METINLASQVAAIIGRSCSYDSRLTACRITVDCQILWTGSKTLLSVLDDDILHANQEPYLEKIPRKGTVDWQ